MANLVDTLDLRKDLEVAGIDADLDFEAIYSRLAIDEAYLPVQQLVEARVAEYFGGLALPDHPTLYDVLLLSLREKDAIFTFNWAPFLVDAYLRHESQGVLLPEIFHLHGNVRVGFCINCRVATVRLQRCPGCSNRIEASRLLYPVAQKNYASDQFIKTQWDAARQFIRNAMIVTVFGYSAPTSDTEAMAILTDAWKGTDKHRLFERVEIIDVRGTEELAEQWSPFSFFHHYDLRRSLFESILTSYPRRTCEKLYYSGVEGKYVEAFDWPGRKSVTITLANLRSSVASLQRFEV